MATITNLNQTSADQLKRIIEDNGITIKKTDSTRYQVICPECNKPEAYIYFNQGSRVIQCNRQKNCNFSQSLWEYIASKHGYPNKEMTGYINKLLGYEFKDFVNEQVGSLTNANNVHKEQKAPEILEKLTTDKPVRTQEEIAEEQKFFKACHQIFTGYLQEQDNEQVTFSLRYLKEDRGYDDKQITSFKLGFFPDEEKFVLLLVNAGYPKEKAKQLIDRYFLGILNINKYQKGHEETKNRITFTWLDTNGNIIGFSTRKPTDDEKIKPKYINNTGLGKADHLFNLTKEAEGKNIVIVEGQFDALGGTYFTLPQEKMKSYHFVAISGNNISERQVACLKALNCKRVILLLDNDEAGRKGAIQTAEKLIAAGISPNIASIPKDCECKDIDELIRKYKDDIDGKYPDLKEIIDNATKYEIAVNPDKPIKETQMEQTKLDPELQALLNKIKSNTKELKELNILDYAKDIHAIRKRLVGETIGLDRRTNPNFITLNNIHSDITEYNNLLFMDEADDKPYTCEQFSEQILKNTNNGLKTGFLELNKHITIQPSSLAFIAGRPSHGKTTMILNILKNMIKDNPDKAFLFYSYEETRDDILIKIILSVTDDGLDQELKDANVEGTNLRERALNDFKKHFYCVKENKQGEIYALSPKLEDAYKEVETWIKDGRLEILNPKSTAESLSTAIIERCGDFKEEEQAKQGGVKKKVAAVFIDYVQKLRTEKKQDSRQQEIQRICQALLWTALDKRVGTSIILGAQANREVKSLDTFTLDNMRESGDIENEGNLVLGVWNETFVKINNLIKMREELIAKQENENTQTIENQINDINNKLDEVKKEQEIVVKILKNRNGQNNGLFKLAGHLDRYFIDDTFDTKAKHINKQL